MSDPEIRLPTSIYDAAAIRKIIGEEIEVATVEAGRYLRIRLPDPSGADLTGQARLAEQLNQVLRASIETRLPALRAEDE